MSSNDPGQPEYLGDDQAPAGAGTGPRSRRRTGIIAASVVAVVAAVGGGAYGVGQLMSGGDSAASAVPADAIAFATLDLDPSAAQKIEAVKIFRKFPGLRSEVKISSRDDLRRVAFDALVKDGGCTGIDYERDVKPWLGERLGVAAVPGSGTEVLPLVALQVTDQDQARAGVRSFERCGTSRSEDAAADLEGVAFVGDYMLLTQSQADADAMAKDAGSSSLADDEGYRTWTKRAGDPGIVTMYASKRAPAAILDEQSRREGGNESGMSRTQLEAAFEGFEGASGVVRFKRGAMEAEFTTKGLGAGMAADTATGPDVRTLPGTTAAALSVAFKDGWANSYLDMVKDLPGGESLDSMLSQGEAQSGLQLPEDIETLLGDGFDVSVDSRTDLQALSTSPDPTKVPAGIRIKGDTARVIAVIDKLKAKAGPAASLVQVQSKDGMVAIGTDKAYVSELLTEGDLGDTSAFGQVVPDAGKANGVLFVSFDAGDGWAERLGDLLSDGDPKVQENIKPLKAFGISSWQDDDQVQHSLLRLTTD